MEERVPERFLPAAYVVGPEETHQKMEERVLERFCAETQLGAFVGPEETQKLVDHLKERIGTAYFGPEETQKLVNHLKERIVGGPETHHDSIVQVMELETDPVLILKTG